MILARTKSVDDTRAFHSGLLPPLSYGEDRPADPGHNENAWAKNRRGEFIVIEPPTAATSK